MTPPNPLIRYRDSQKILHLSLISLFLIGTGFIAYEAITKMNVDILFITPFLLFCAYVFLTYLVNETIVFEEDGFLKSRSGPLPVWKKHPPIPVNDIIGFHHTTETIDTATSYIIQAIMSDGEVRKVLSVDEIGKAIDAVNVLTASLRGGALQCDQERFLKRIQDLKNGRWRPNFSHVSNDEELIAILKQYTDKLITFVGLFEERQLVQWELATLLKQHETRFRAILPTLNVTNDDVLFMIYLAMTKYEKDFQAWMISEVDRLFNDAIETQNTDLIHSLDAFEAIDVRQGRGVRQAIRERILFYLTSSQDYIREQAVSFLGMMAEDNVQGTLNILSDVVMSDSSRGVRSAASEQIKFLNPDHRGGKLSGLDRVRGRGHEK